jgi:AcrR family transcriptional regulator
MATRTTKSATQNARGTGKPGALALADAGTLPAARRVPVRHTAAAPPPDRRLAILLAAEKLFATHGFHGVSIRDIAQEAGVPLALVGYYYGAKHELYHAIFQSWQGSIDQRRERLRAAIAAAEGADVLEQVLDAFIAPVVALHADPAGRWYARMAARDLAAPTPESDRAAREFFDPMAHHFIDAVQALYPRRTRGEAAWCYQFMLGAMLHFLSDVRVERLSRGQNKAADPARKDTLLAFVAAGFRAVLQSGLPATAQPKPPAPKARTR